MEAAVKIFCSGIRSQARPQCLTDPHLAFRPRRAPLCSRNKMFPSIQQGMSTLNITETGALDHEESTASSGDERATPVPGFNLMLIQITLMYTQSL